MSVFWGTGEGCVCGPVCCLRLGFCTSFLLLRADSPGRRQPPLLVFLSPGGHLDAHLHGNRTPAELQRPRPRRDGNAHDPAGLPGLGEGARSAVRPPTQPALVLDENKDVTEGEIGLALAAGQEVVLPWTHPPRTGGGRLRRGRPRSWVMVDLRCEKETQIEREKKEPSVSEKKHYQREKSTEQRFSPETNTR